MALLSTPAVERAVCRLLGVDGAGSNGLPVPNLFIEWLGAHRLAAGAAYWLGALVSATGRTADDLAFAAAAGELDSVLDAGEAPPQAGRAALRPALRRVEGRFVSLRERRPPVALDASARARIGGSDAGADRTAAVAAIEAGARAIELVRTPEQRSLDLIPYGLARGDERGFVTQARLAALREAIDAAASRTGADVSLWTTVSGPCLPEFAVIGALERVDVLLLEPGSRANALDRAFALGICRRTGMLLDPIGTAVPAAPDERPPAAFVCDERRYWNPAC